MVIGAFRRDNLFADKTSDRCIAAQGALSVHHYRAGSTLFQAAAEFRALEAKLVAKNEQKRCVEG